MRDDGEPPIERAVERSGLGDAPRSVRAHSLCIASGKGGVGKSVIAASLAHVLSQRGRTLLLDADFGVGNAHILQGLHPERTLVDVVVAGMAIDDAIAPCVPGLDLLAAGSGVSRMAELSPFEIHIIASGLERIEADYAHVLVDSAAGVSNQTAAFAAASDIVLLVTTPDVTAMTDAYAFFKVLRRRRPSASPLLVVNRAHDYDEAYSVATRMDKVSRRYLGRAPRWIGFVPLDEAVTASVNARRPVVAFDPHGPAARAIHGLAVALVEEIASLNARGLGRSLLSRVGYSPEGGGPAARRGASGA